VSRRRARSLSACRDGGGVASLSSMFVWWGPAWALSVLVQAKAAAVAAAAAAQAAFNAEKVGGRLGPPLTGAARCRPLGLGLCVWRTWRVRRGCWRLCSLVSKGRVE
jgi:hypothetical protein